MYSVAAGLRAFREFAQTRSAHGGDQGEWVWLTSSGGEEKVADLGLCMSGVNVFSPLIHPFNDNEQGTVYLTSIPIEKWVTDF
jgi:hypothetical protein